MDEIKVGQIWYKQKTNESMLVIKITDELGDDGKQHPCVWWVNNHSGFINKDCLNACRHGFFTDNGYVLVK